jgi:hypothetical protein
VQFLYALTSSQLNALAAVMAAGFLIAVIGHVLRFRFVVIIGILVIGAVSVYFGIFVAKVR